MYDDSEGPGGPDEKPLFTSRRREKLNRSRRRITWIASLLVLALVGVGSVWLWRRSHPVASPGATPTVSTDVPSATPSTPAGETLDLPTLGASDEVVRRVVSGLSARPQWASWLVSDDLVRRFVLAVVAVADGRSPAEHLPFLVPEDPFSVRESGEGMVVDPQSYHRYDVVVSTFTSLDTQGVAKLFRQLHPLMEDAYRELGLPNRSFDDAVREAFAQLLGTKVPAPPVAVEPDGGLWAFSDPAVEGLSPAQKDLVRMGPDNAAVVQAKLRELADALGVPR
jgi:hypothetical protein